MDPFFTFLMEHWILSTIFVVLVVVFLLNEWRNRAFGMTQLTSQQLVEFLNHDQATVLDIRPTSQYQGGHILGAINLPKEEVMTNLNALNKYKNKPLILVCAAGLDAPKLGRLLKTHQGMQIFILAGGMENWHAQGLPVVKG